MTKQVFKNCLRCTKVFEPPANKRKTRIYCSRSCANKSNSSVQSVTKRKKTKQNLGNTIKWRYNVLYIEWRNYCLVRDNFICQRCEKEVRGKNQATVHHIKSWKDYPMLRYEISNGVTLCRACHNIVDENLCKGRYGYC